MRRRKTVIEAALEDFLWLMKSHHPDRCEAGENVCAALAWVLGEPSPIPELLAEIHKLRGLIGSKSSTRRPAAKSDTAK